MNQPLTSNITTTTPTTNQSKVSALPSADVLGLQKTMGLTKDEARNRIDLLKYNIPVIPLSLKQQQALKDFQKTPDNAPQPTPEMSQQIKNATVPLNLRDSNDPEAIAGSGTILGVSNDRTKILLGTGIHSFLNMLDIDPNSTSKDDMITRAKVEIQKRLGKSFSNTDQLTIPLKDRNGNQLNVKDAKFIAVTGPNGSEHILVEVELDKPLDPSFAPLAVESTQSELEQGSRILTGGYTPEGYRESLNGRVVSTTLQSGVANDRLPNGEDPKGDDKTYNDIFLVSNVPGVQPGTSGGTVVILDNNGKVVYIGTITAKNNRDNVAWISSINQDFVNKITHWNNANSTV